MDLLGQDNSAFVKEEKKLVATPLADRPETKYQSSIPLIAVALA